jgi:oligoendopeptidase F
MAFEKNWIESEIRAGKAPGGFCTSSTVIEQSRIFMTYTGERIDAQILAHELGHAFHNELMRGLRPLACGFSLSLCETASIFAEALFTGAILDDPESSPEEKAAVLDTRAKEAVSCLLNIPARFAFEKAFHEERARGEVPVSRLKELSLQALSEAYGDALAEDSLDPYFWTKGHLYCTDVSFYNYPYSFGYLLSLGMMARFKEEGPGFLPRYEKFLRMTGSFDARELAKDCVGADIESEDFWLGSIALIEQDVQRFEEAVPGVLGMAS